MKQARTLNDRELKNLLTLVARRRYALRDRNMLLLTHWAGMRIGEVAALLIGDVVGLNGEIVLEINLKPHQTKGDHSRSVVLSTRMRSELRQYLEPLAKLPKRAEFFWRSAVSACAGQAGAGLELATRSI